MSVLAFAAAAAAGFAETAAEICQIAYADFVAAETAAADLTTVAAGIAAGSAETAAKILSAGLRQGDADARLRRLVPQRQIYPQLEEQVGSGEGLEKVAWLDLGRLAMAL